MSTETLTLHLTRQRRVILEAIKKVRTHPSADQVYEMVRETMPRISLGTVYRNLELLCREGLIQRLEGRTQKYYDGETCNHIHFRCVKCEALLDLPVEIPVDVEQVRKRVPGFDIQGQKVEFFGVCKKCSGK
jgi:Fur family ferric uptake transcriptional regulator